MNLRTTFLLVVFLAVVAGYFFFFQARRSGTTEPEPPWFYTATMEDIQRITITTPGQSRAFRQERDGWAFEEPAGLPVDPARWGGITLLLSGPQSRRLLASSVEDPAKFGLTSPQGVVSVELRGERQVRILLGQRTPDGSAHYAQQEGDPRLFLVDASWGEVLTRLVTEPPYPEWFYQVPRDRLLYLGVAAEGKEAAFVPEDGGWRFATPERTPVDPERWKEVAPLLGGPPSLRLLASKVEEPARYGLDAPTLIVRAEYRPPPTLQEVPRRGVEMQVGRPLPDGTGYYARPRDLRTGKDLPFLLAVDKTWVEVLRRLALNPPVGPKGG